MSQFAGARPARLGSVPWRRAWLGPASIRLQIQPSWGVSRRMREGSPGSTAEAPNALKGFGRDSPLVVRWSYEARAGAVKLKPKAQYKQIGLATLPGRVGDQGALE